jgi:hypothetical protein
MNKIGSRKPTSDSIRVEGCRASELPVCPERLESGEVADIKPDKGFGFIRYQ